MQNTFKNNHPPKSNKQREIEETIDRSAAPVLKLNPPVFEVDLVQPPKVNRLQFSIFRTL